VAKSNKARRAKRKPAAALRAANQPTAVVAVGRIGVPGGLPVRVDGVAGRLYTGLVGTLPEGAHSFRLTHAGRTYANTRQCFGGRPPASPNIVHVTTQVAGPTTAARARGTGARSARRTRARRRRKA
jgi:hypothetical protein